MKKTLFLLMIVILAGCTKAPASGEPATANLQTDVINQSISTEAPPDDTNQNQSDTSSTGAIDESTSSSTIEDYGEYFFVYNNIEIRINDKFSETLAALGEYQDYFEAPSCAFEGIDKTYYYNGFEIMTYPGGDEDYIFSISLADDNNYTPEGICLGASIDEMTAAYGEDYEKDMGLYVYTKGRTKLMFLTESDVVVSITYEMVLDDE